MTQTTVLIVGAGPAGLATAGRLRHVGIPFEVLESSSQLVDSWQNHYDRLCLHTIKRFSGLPHMPLPDNLPEYVPRKELIQYYQEYARTYSIAPHFGEEAVEIKREDDQWVTLTKAGNRYHSEAVVVCTGFNRIPNIPDIPGLADFSGTFEHSRSYQNPAPFSGKKVLVVGMGNSGAEIALDLVEKGVEASLSVRGPVNIVPRDINGRPTQVTAKIIDRLPNWFGDWLARQIQKLVIGDLSKFGIQRPQISPRKQLRKLGKTPVLDIGTVERIKSGELGIRPGIERIEKDQVHFKDGSKETFDHLVFATGYRSAIPGFVKDSEALMNAHGHPAQPIAPESHRNLYFVGFDAYASGLLESIYRDSRRVVAHFLHNINEESAKV